MNLRLMTIFSLISGLFLLMGLILGYIILQPSTPTSSFPFQVSGGTLIGINPENHTGIIWGQSFEIKINQIFNSTIRTEDFTLLVYNFPTSDISFTGLEEKELLTINGPLQCKLELTGNIRFNRTVILTHTPNDKSMIKFLTMGDTQGFTELYEEMIASDQGNTMDFILHLGDITASGNDKSLQKFQKISKTSNIPVFTTPGNHDIKLSDSTTYYERYFGKAEYFFEYNGFLFITLNSSSGFYSENSFSLLTELLLGSPSTPKIIFTHVPIFDPRPGKDHALINVTQTSKLLSLLNNSNVKAVISGHIHYFNHTLRNGIHFITSGGGGAYLYETPEDGGFHHFTEITIDSETKELTVVATPLTKLNKPTDVIVAKEEYSVTVSIEDILSEFSLTSGNGSFQNQYDNWRANGSYIGIKINELINIVGGMTENQWVTVKSWDGLTSNYSYSVIYPNSSWYQIQGDMILAFSYNDMIVPNYGDGYRIVFLPPDGGYSNEDCKNTSPPNEGWYIYPSAGFRWVKYVQSLTIVGEG
ncbi:MAG: metallophosphoesterase [Candidatus Hodarchaeales archaeon]|jgi:predicted phosphodiesterase